MDIRIKKSGLKFIHSKVPSSDRFCLILVIILPLGLKAKEKNILSILGVHANEDKQFECYICSEKFSWKISLDRHLTRFHGNPEYIQCKLCPRQFKVQSILQEHVRRVHQNLKNYSCDQCDKKFFKKGDLKVGQFL